MLVQCKQTKQELEMFWIEVPAFLVPETLKVLDRCVKGSDEGYCWEDTADKDPYEVRFRIVATVRHHEKIVSKLVKKGLLSRYDNEHPAR